jgi:hypothetical protein
MMVSTERCWEAQATVKKVLTSPDHVAFLTQAGWLPVDAIMPWMNPMVVKAWAEVDAYVDYESQRRHEPNCYEQARELAARCVEWRSRNLLDAEITWLDNAL